MTCGYPTLNGTPCENGTGDAPTCHWHTPEAIAEQAEAKSLIVESYGRTGSVIKAALAGGVTYNTVYAWRKADPRFDADMKIAQQEAAEQVVGTLFERFVNGWTEVWWDKQGGRHESQKFLGEKAASILLAAWRPHEFGNRITVDVPDREGFEQVEQALTDEEAFAAALALVNRDSDDDS